MSAPQTVVAEPRQLIGTTKSRRLRRDGLIPGNVYGLGQPNISITMPSDTITRVIRSGTHVVDLQIGENLSKAIVRESQWNVFKTKLLHVDFQRVDPDARVDIEVDVVARGQISAGVMDHLIHKVTLNCLAYLIPDRIEVRVNHLKIGDSVSVSSLELPTGATCKLAGDAVVIRVHEAKKVDIVQASDTGAQPEVIGRKKPEEEAAAPAKGGKGGK